MDYGLGGSERGIIVPISGRIRGFGARVASKSGTYCKKHLARNFALHFKCGHSGKDINVFGKPMKVMLAFDAAGAVYRWFS